VVLVVLLHPQEDLYASRIRGLLYFNTLLHLRLAAYKERLC
jgi:hypothetical protein